MILELNGTKVTIVDKTLGYQGDNLVNTVQVTVDKDSAWNYRLDMYKGKSKCFDSVLLMRNGNICTVDLTDEILSYGGRYSFQLRGYTDEKTYHSEIFEAWVNGSIEYNQENCGCDNALPQEFYQVENNVTEINNHPPYPGDSGKWMIWDVNKHEYVESDIAVIGGGDGGVLTVNATYTSETKLTADKTFKEIWDYINQGKGSAVLKVVGTSIWDYALVFAASDMIMEFASVEIRGDIIVGRVYTCNTSNQWEFVQTEIDLRDFEKVANKTTELTAESTDVQYPSAKAVYTAVQEVAKTAGKIDSITVNGTPQPIEDKTAEITIDKATVGLGNVDNTSDEDKPISNATQTALNEKLGDDEVYDWAKVKLPFTANEITDTYNPVADCFVTNPTNFADGKPYFRYHAGSKSFTWTNPNPIRGKVTITVLAWKQWGKDSGGNVSALKIGYSDGTSQSFVMPNGTVYEFTTNDSKTLTTIKGNYDLESWVLLDLTVLKIAYDDGVEAPFALKTDVPAVVSVTASATVGQAADAKSTFNAFNGLKETAAHAAATADKAAEDITAMQTALNTKLDESDVVSVTASATTGQVADAKSVYDEIQNAVAGMGFVVTITYDSSGTITADKTFAEILAALDGGASVMLLATNANGSKWIYEPFYRSDTYLFFTATNPAAMDSLVECYQWICSSDDKWSSGRTKLETTSRMTQTISDSPSAVKYTSEKAVADYVSGSLPTVRTWTAADVEDAI